LRVMSEIAGIFSSRSVSVISMTAEDVITPSADIAFESGVVADELTYSDISYQDFEVIFTGTYAQLRDVLAHTEASDSLLEVVELSFDSQQRGDVNVDGSPADNAPRGEHTYTIVFRTYGLPIDTSV